ncbi:MAG: alpha/beta hydrolase [Beijerinckiaceae bacterium]|nr:alpha/beta hydrolase [Beijerinckiaceae bacterium]
MPIVLLHGCGSLAEEIERPFLGIDARLIAPDRPGYGFSDPLPQAERGPGGQARWLEALLRCLRIDRTILVAHSLAAGPALILAASRPDLVEGLLLLAPFCRPTPHQAMPLLRAAVSPVIGPLLCRTLLPALATAIGRRSLRGVFHPNRVPAELSAFPFDHAAKSSSLKAAADELRAFNADMQALKSLPSTTDVRILHGKDDGTADPRWHLGWLLGRHPKTCISLLEGVGHMPHHVAPRLTRSSLKNLMSRHVHRKLFGAASIA